MTTTWKESRERRMLILSASQISTAHLCVRKWWLERVRKLRVQEDTGKFVFGSIFHACVERYLEADDQGRDRKTGKAVDLFPDGWMNEYDRYSPEKITGTINEEEAGIIKSLITKGIEAGVLAPYPDRRIEREFRWNIGKVDSVDGYEPVTVQIVGFIDCDSRNTVIDHKTTSDMRYALSPKALSEDIQMLLYGNELLADIKARTGKEPEQIVLRHNQFCKKPSKLAVRSTETTVTVRYLRQMWETIIFPTIEKMVRFRDQANSWAELPEPATSYKACNKYGGCNYMNICGGRLTESQMERRLDNSTETTKLTTGATDSATPPPDKGNLMPSLADKLAAMKKNKQAAANAAPVTDAPKEEPKTEPAAQPQAETKALPEGMVPPPWANEGCSACGGLGFNTKGNPCRVCEVKTKVKTSDYKIESQDDGSVMWFLESDPDQAGVSAGPTYGREEPKATEKTQAEVVDEKPEPPKEEPVPKAKDTPKEATVEEPAPVQSEGAGSGSFTLYVNCRPTKTGKGIPKSHDLHEIIEDARCQLAEVGNVDSFYELDPFKRRDRIAELAPQVSEHVGKGALVACGVSTGASEIRALLDALKPLARQVIVGDMN